MATISFDESGFTGNDPLNKDQPVFIFSGVVIDEDEAQRIIDEVIDKHKPQGYDRVGFELKGKTLKKRGRGRRLLEDVLKAIDGRARIFCAEKRFGLAAQMFEYLIEPVMAPKSLILYERNFHRYVAGMAHAGLATNQPGAEDFFKGFRDFLKARDISEAPALFEIGHPLGQAKDFFGDFKRFVTAHRARLQSQFEEPEESRVESKADKWMLDLSINALHTLLLEFGKTHQVIDAVCDSSKPLVDSVRMLDRMINSGPQKAATILGENRPLTYNLKSSVSFKESHCSAGVQLADLVAAATAFALQDDSSEAERWRQDYILSVVSEYSMFPDYDYCKPENREGLLGRTLFKRLVERSAEGADPLDGLEEFVALVEAKISNIGSGSENQAGSVP